MPAGAGFAVERGALVRVLAVGQVGHGGDEDPLGERLGVENQAAIAAS